MPSRQPRDTPLTDEACPDPLFADHPLKGLIGAGRDLYKDFDLDIERKEMLDQEITGDSRS